MFPASTKHEQAFFHLFVQESQYGSRLVIDQVASALATPSSLLFAWFYAVGLWNSFPFTLVLSLAFCSIQLRTVLTEPDIVHV